MFFAELEGAEVGAGPIPRVKILIVRKTDREGKCFRSERREGVERGVDARMESQERVRRLSEGKYTRGHSKRFAVGCVTSHWWPEALSM